MRAQTPFALDNREELATWHVPKPSPCGTPKRHLPPPALSHSYNAAKGFRAEAFWDKPYMSIASAAPSVRKTVVFEAPTSIALCGPASLPILTSAIVRAPAPESASSGMEQAQSRLPRPAGSLGVRHPIAVEPEGHAGGQVDHRDRTGFEVLGV